MLVLVLVRMLRCGSALANLQLGSGAASADGVGALLASQFSPAGWLGLDGTYLLASLTLVSAAHWAWAWARGHVHPADPCMPTARASSRPVHVRCTCPQVGVTGFLTLGMLGPMLWPGGRGQQDSFLVVMVRRQSHPHSLANCMRTAAAASRTRSSS